MKPTRFRLLLALLILLGFTVIVGADGTTQAKEHQIAAFQQDSKNTEAKLNGALVLSPSVKIKDEKKEEAKKKGTKTSTKKTAKKAEPPKKTPKQKYPGLDAKTAAYVVELDRKIDIYNESAGKAKEAGDEDLAQLYLKAAAKESAKKAALMKPESSEEDNLAVENAVKAESQAFDKIVKRTDKNDLDAEQKQYIRTEVITPLERSTVFFEELLNRALKPLLQQYLGSPGAVLNTAATVYNISQGGCASTGSAIATGVTVANVVIPIIRSLIDLVQYMNQDTQQTITSLNTLVE